MEEETHKKEREESQKLNTELKDSLYKAAKFYRQFYDIAKQICPSIETKKLYLKSKNGLNKVNKKRIKR